ncbi:MULTISPECIES: hypothetical protein [unclassified Rathayibacter]|jgi:hypothetical protein|uniref:hypothetical protein n=1 Tax=unclassified Rathayibacter TaxID=2609250 RepID=UPI000CE79FB0|nr:MULTISPECIES: hypothetical protein [unclassified Rathayibacter]PPG04411.1 hypothetical protein C5C26_13890 [Rathayibacter sp. AY2B1]PPG68433.1 hypothetical protein C5C59_12625 [Rathayibacter sp. AY1F4]
MQRTVGGVVIEVVHARTGDATRTPDGPIQLWTITLSGAGVDHSATVGVAGTSTEPDDDALATVLDVAVVEYVPASEDQHGTPAFREWKRDHASELRQLVAALRAGS